MKKASTYQSSRMYLMGYTEGERRERERLLNQSANQHDKEVILKNNLEIINYILERQEKGYEAENILKTLVIDLKFKTKL